MLVVALPANAAASAWNISNTELLIISRVDYFDADLGMISVMGAPTPARFQRVESNTYLEYGVTEKIMIGGKVLYGTSWLTRGADTETASGFTEIEGFAQAQLFRNSRHAGAIKIALAAPPDFGAGARPAQASDGIDAEVSTLYGCSIIFKPVKIFAAAELGFRKRFSASADQAKLLTTIGVEPAKRWTLLIDTFSVKSLGNDDPGGADFDVIKIQPSVVWRLGRHTALQAGFNKEVAGRNLDLGHTFFIGIQTRF